VFLHPYMVPYFTSCMCTRGAGRVRSAFYHYSHQRSWFSAPLNTCWVQGWWTGLDQEFKMMEKYRPTKHICRRDARVNGIPWAFPLQIRSIVCLFVYLILQKLNQGALSSRSCMLYYCCRCLHRTTIDMFDAGHWGNKKISFNFINWFVLLCHALL